MSPKHGSTLKNYKWLCTSKGYGHMLIINSKHNGIFKRSLVTSYNGLSINSKKKVETKMKTTIGLYGKGNESRFLMCTSHMNMSSPE
jgi:hypothetical protein